MRSHCFYFCLLVIANSVLSCNRQVSETVTLQFDLRDPDLEFLVVQNLITGVLDSIDVFPDRPSIREVAITGPQILNFVEGDERHMHYVYVEPNTAIELVRKPDADNALQVLESSRLENQYLQQFAECKKTMLQQLDLFYEAAVEPAQFKGKVEEYYKPFSALMLQMSENQELDPSFKRAMTNRLAAMKAKDLMLYDDAFSFYFGGIPEDIPDIEEVDELVLDETLLLFEEGRVLGQQILHKEIVHRGLSTPSGIYRAHHHHAQVAFSNPLLKEYYQLRALQRLVDYQMGVDEAASFLDEYRQGTSNVHLVKRMEATIAPWQSLRKGKSASPLLGKTPNGELVRLEDLRGQTLYIHLWATWCNPCGLEFIQGKMLKEELGAANVQFVHVSIDDESDWQKWVDQITKEQPEGIQLIAAPKWKSKLEADYNIHHVPRYLLIDANSKIVSANAPRPSDPAARELIESTLRQY